MNLSSNIILKFRESSLGLKYRARIAKWPGYQTTIEPSLVFWFKRVLRCFSTLIRETSQLSQQQKILKRQSQIIVKKMSKSGNFQDALLIGNGPSAKELTKEEVERFKKIGGQVAAMNGFVNSSIAQRILPDFYFVIDPDYWDMETSESQVLRKKLANLIELNPKMIIVQPFNKPKLIDWHNSYIYIDGRSIAGIVRSSDPFRPWGLPASVTLMAISLLNKLGFNQIYYTGLDSNTYMNFYVDEINRVYFDSSNNYFFTNSPQGKHTDSKNRRFASTWQIRNMADVFYAQAIFLRDMEKCLDGRGVNIGNDRTNDISARACLLR